MINSRLRWSSQQRSLRRDGRRCHRRPGVCAGLGRVRITAAAPHRLAPPTTEQLAQASKVIASNISGVMSLSKADAPVSMLNTGAKVVLPFVAVVLSDLPLWWINRWCAGTLCQCPSHFLHAVFLHFVADLVRLRRCQKTPYCSFVWHGRQRWFGHGLDGVFPLPGELLMEDNGSVRAQALSNIIRFSTTAVGVGLAGMVVAGTLFASLMSGPSRTIHFEEE